ncbi:MAG TPA: ATP synthase F1 subunit gamma [Candidatus Binataceae bacterium]|nr:ATP synthase F1 subunit gamma [Candidatus Binataceae bacterium]
MATLKALRRRIASVKSTQQVTRAMKLVSAAKLRRAQEALLRARPYAETLARVAESLLAGEAALRAPAPGARPAVLIAVIGSDRGLCGGYNANLLRMAEEIARQRSQAGRQVHFIAVGRKVLDHLRRASYPREGERINNHPRLATVELASALATQLLSQFQLAKFEEVGVLYSQFRSALSQRPTYEQILPVKPPAEGDQQTGLDQYLMEPGRAELVPEVLRSYVEEALFHGLLEAEASEHAARMAAMDSATSNASDLIDRLTLEMNRARQASITRELMDIVGGAEALS